jgi:hypothetical protein
LKKFNDLIIEFGIDKNKKLIFIVFKKIKINTINKINRRCKISCVRKYKNRWMKKLKMVILNGYKWGVCKVVYMWKLLFVKL